VAWLDVGEGSDSVMLKVRRNNGMGKDGMERKKKNENCFGQAEGALSLCLLTKKVQKKKVENADWAGSIRQGGSKKNE
jgi:hypothetical protein